MFHPSKQSTTESPERQIYSIWELNRDVRTLLERGFPLLWLQGEISNFSAPGSGHWYFSLKDEKAQARCAMFKMRNRTAGFVPENGMLVLVRARITLYEPRGEFQLVIENMEEAGDGALQRAFELLKKKLEQEGLFDAQHKKPLPPLPRHIGVITSPTGAAIRDILSVLKRRFPAIPVTIYPVLVQGEAAAGQIVEALTLANQRKECDVLLLSRGGGSIEDLWPFNEEKVARAIFASQIPVVSGVGHEIDFTIADFVADQRAPTPSAAAELVTPDGTAIARTLEHYSRRLQQLFIGQLAQRRERVSWLSGRILQPQRMITDQAQRVDELELRLIRAQGHLLNHSRHRLADSVARLQQHSPRHVLAAQKQQLLFLTQRLVRENQRQQDIRTLKLAAISHALHTVSPLATLARGYAITTAGNGEILVNATQTRPDELLTTRLHQGEVVSKVVSIKHD